jgi:hypothetical protein
VNKQPKAYLEGGGIESLAADFGFPGENISILKRGLGVRRASGYRLYGIPHYIHVAVPLESPQIRWQR